MAGVTLQIKISFGLWTFHTYISGLYSKYFESKAISRTTILTMHVTSAVIGWLLFLEKEMNQSFSTDLSDDGEVVLGTSSSYCVFYLTSSS